MEKGSKVLFGRANGEKTQGVVVKVNPKTIKVQQTEARYGHPIGTLWSVDPAFVTLLDSTPSIKVASSPKVSTVSIIGRTFKQGRHTFTVTRLEPSNPKYQVILTRDDGKQFKATQTMVTSSLNLETGNVPAKRSEKEILWDIGNVYCDLSPENLSCDGERSNRDMAIARTKLRRRLEVLFQELGRRVSEDEAFTLTR